MLRGAPSTPALFPPKRSSGLSPFGLRRALPTTRPLPRKAWSASLLPGLPSSTSGSENPFLSKACLVDLPSSSGGHVIPVRLARVALRLLRPAPSLAPRCGKKTVARSRGPGNQNALQHEILMGISCWQFGDIPVEKFRKSRRVNGFPVGISVFVGNSAFSAGAKAVLGGMARNRGESGGVEGGFWGEGFACGVRAGSPKARKRPVDVSRRGRAEPRGAGRMADRVDQKIAPGVRG